jgi:hypothetical protein
MKRSATDKTESNLVYITGKLPSFSNDYQKRFTNYFILGITNLVNNNNDA